MSCRVKTNRHGFLAYRLFWRGLKSWEGTGLKDTPENRHVVEAQAVLMAHEIKHGVFDYLKWFPHGNKAHLFRQESPQLSLMTVEAFYRDWIEEQPSRVRPHRVKEYESHFQNHILPARIGSGTFGKLPLSAVTNVHLSSLQDRLREKGLKANSVNGVVHSCLRALFRDARAKRLVSGDLFDKVFFIQFGLHGEGPGERPHRDRV